jgi:hypothetical protein
MMQTYTESAKLQRNENEYCYRNRNAAGNADRDDRMENNDYSPLNGCCCWLSRSIAFLLRLILPSFSMREIRLVM